MTVNVPFQQRTLRQPARARRLAVGIITIILLACVLALASVRTAHAPTPFNAPPALYASVTFCNPFGQLGACMLRGETLRPLA